MPKIDRFVKVYYSAPLIVKIFEQRGLKVKSEYRFTRPRRWRFDYAWPDKKIAFEIEGGTWTRSRHTTGSGYEADCEKYSVAAILGWCVVRATTTMVKDGRALQLLEQAFNARVNS